MKTQVVIVDLDDGHHQFPLKARYDERRRNVPVDSNIMAISAQDDEARPIGQRPEGAIPLPDVNQDIDDNHTHHQQCIVKPVEPEAPESRSPEQGTSVPGEVADSTKPGPPSKASANATAAKEDVPGTTKPLGFSKAMKVISWRKAPNGNHVYYVKGGTVVSDEFTKTTKSSPRPPHISGTRWNEARNDKIEQWGWQREWNEMHPDAAVKEIQLGTLLHAPTHDSGTADSEGGKPSEAILAQNADAAPAYPGGTAAAAPASKPEDDFPRMPTTSRRSTHRTIITPEHKRPLFSAAVARPVKRDEINRNPKAQASVDVEWAKLRKTGEKGCWDESRVRSKAKLLAEHRRSGTKCHWGRVFALCVEKGSELEENDPNRKFKGRVVFQGNNVKDENYDHALFADLGSSPCTMQAGKMADAIGLLAGNEVQTSDAEAAYTQAKLKGIDTWIEIPKDQWPESWHKLPYDDPVCPLVYALYGHPDSGGYWEQHCDEHVKSIGFNPLSSQGWASCYWHARLKCFLVVYVDDFKMAGPVEALSEAWSLLRTIGPKGTKGLKIEDPKRGDTRYLGCEHKYKVRPLPKHRNFMVEIKEPVPKPPKKPKDDADSGTEGHHLGADGAAKARPPATPHKNQVKEKFKLIKDHQHSHRAPPKTVNTIEWDQSGFLQQCVARYKDLGGARAEKLKRVDTPYVDESKEFNLEGHAGYLAPVASKILMKVLYAARMGRFDLLRATAFLACYVTKWTEEHDRRLHRLMCYINSTLHIKMTGWIGDPIEDLQVCVFSDADWAGEKTTFKSTTGAFVCLVGPNSFFPLSAMSKKQTCVSHSTPEAEIVAADMAIKNEGLPIMTLWEILNNKPKHSMQGQFFEDNETGAHIMTTGRNPTMRHIGRTHGICIAWLNERFRPLSEKRVADFVMRNCPTDYMSADIFTKFFTLKDKWLHAMRLIGICDPAELWGSGSAAPAVPLWGKASTPDSHEASFARAIEAAPRHRRLRFWFKDYAKVKELPITWLGKMRSKHTHAIVIQSTDGQIIDVLRVVRPVTFTERKSIRIIQIHTDPNFARNGKVADKLHPQLAALLPKTNGAASIESAAAAATSASYQDMQQDSAQQSGPTLTVDYQLCVGGSSLAPAIGSTGADQCVLFHAPRDFTLPCGSQALIGLRNRIRLPGGVPCILQAAVGASPTSVRTFGEAMPVSDTYHGELYITVPNLDDATVHIKQGDIVAMLRPLSMRARITLCPAQFWTPSGFKGGFMKAIVHGNTSYRCVDNHSYVVAHASKSPHHAHLDGILPSAASLTAAFVAFPGGDVCAIMRYPNLTVAKVSERLRGRSEWLSAQASACATPCNGAILPRMFAQLRAYFYQHCLSRVEPWIKQRYGNGFQDRADADFVAAAGVPQQRFLHEWCCGPTSLISSGISRRSAGCLCQRTTEAEDGTTDAATQRAAHFMSRRKALLWSSMPCTGGSPWQTVNAKKPGGYARLRQHVRLFNRLWRNFETLARYAHSKGNHIALEWPRNCKYWKLPKVKALCKSIGLEQVHFDGCMLGLTSVVDGKPIKKPWTIATSSKEIIKQFEGLLCQGHKDHRPCEGVDTKLTEDYTPEFTNRLHIGWCKECEKN